MSEVYPVSVLDPELEFKKEVLSPFFEIRERGLPDGNTTKSYAIEAFSGDAMLAICRETVGLLEAGVEFEDNLRLSIDLRYCVSRTYEEIIKERRARGFVTRESLRTVTEDIESLQDRLAALRGLSF